MASLVNKDGRPRLFTMEARPKVSRRGDRKTLSIREPDDSALGVYMFANLISDDTTRKHTIFDYFTRAKKVRVTFEIIEEDNHE
jgi:hypothetical protein